MNRGVVVEIKKRHQIVLTPTGEFKRVPLKTSAAIGEEIRFDSAARIARSPFRIRWGIGAAAILLLLLFIPVFVHMTDRQAAVAAYLTMDINPSLEIGVDHKERVIELQALNKSASDVIAGIKFEGQPLEQVAETIMDRVNEGLYFKNGGGDVFITSVLVGDNSDTDFERILTSQVTEAINKALTKLDTAVASNVEVNTMSVPQEVRDEAIEVGLSTGKMAFYLVARSLGHEIGIQELQQGSIHKAAQSWGGVSTILNEEELFGQKQQQDKRKDQKARLKTLLEEAKNNDRKELPEASVNEKKETKAEQSSKTESPKQDGSGKNPAASKPAQQTESKSQQQAAKPAKQTTSKPQAAKPVKQTEKKPQPHKSEHKHKEKDKEKDKEEHKEKEKEKYKEKDKEKKNKEKEKKVREKEKKRQKQMKEKEKEKKEKKVEKGEKPGKRHKKMSKGEKEYAKWRGAHQKECDKKINI
ncbi:anti-sigma factor domain-containing protein [Paenibacillus sp. GCM10027626]|uniref:anti-sigma-I factor RsgI family protein n=1 Tax=Paenibacillus sp. GCM10027626 TaxID=3273411 RepID=UPI00363C0250